MSARIAAAALGLAIAAAPVAVAPAHAIPADDAFMAALDAAGVSVDNPAVAKNVARSICPSLKSGAKTMTWLVAGVTMQGIPRQVATTFVGLAVRTYCPKMIKNALS